MPVRRPNLTCERACSGNEIGAELSQISLFPKEITVHSGIVWRDKIYGDKQICERVEVSTIILSNINFLHDQKLNTSFLTHGYSVGVFVSYCYQPQNQQFLLFSSSLLCAPGTGQTGLECFVIRCFHNACKHRALDEFPCLDLILR